MKLKHCRLAVTIGLLAIWSSPVIANDPVFHGRALAELNEHGHLVVAVDRFVGPNQAEDGKADVVFIFASSDKAALGEAADAISRASARLNLDHARLDGGAVLKLGLPELQDFWLVVEHTAAGVGGPDGASLVETKRVDGLALGEVDVTAKTWSMAEAFDHFRDFDILGPS